MDTRVGDLRERLGLDRPAVAAERTNGAERATLAAWSTGALSFASATLAILVTPIVLAAAKLP